MGKNEEVITVVDVYESLPNINCGKCGVKTCLEFSAKLVKGEFKPNRCVHLYEKGNEQNAKDVEKMFIALGFVL